MRSITDQLILLIDLLKRAIGVHLDRQARMVPHVPLGLRLPPEHLPRPKPQPPAPKPLPQAIYLLFAHRVNRLCQRFLALYARWQQGTLHRPRPKRARTLKPQDPNAVNPNVPKPIRLPRAFGWANKRIPEAAPPSGYLEDLLHNRAAELRPFLQAAPQAGRLLRPLANALGVRLPPDLRLPQRPRKPRPRRPRAPRPLPLTHPDLALPPNVIRAVRYWRKKYGRD